MLSRTLSPLRTTAALGLVLSSLLVLASCDEPQSSGDGDAGLACAVGTTGCACAQGGACATTANGEALSCVEGLCIPSTCAAGSTGCVCRGGTRCDVASDVCTQGVCKAADCVAGELHCDCLAGTCGAGLFCDAALGDGTCVDATGHPGGPCPSNGLCLGQNRCDPSSRTCVHCEPGSQACVPSATGCNEGLGLAAGRCVPSTEIAPANPTCRTECRPAQGLGVSHPACGPDGFIEGCTDGFACMDGSCVRFGGEPPTCTKDSECPSFQTCAETVGRCYSNCDERTACPMGLTCDRHVCRVPCARSADGRDACPSGTFCDLSDGLSGVCMPLSDVPTDLDPSTRVEGSFTLAPSAVLLTDVRRSATVGLSTDARTALTFTVRTLEHRTYDATGALVEEVKRADGGIPMPFLDIAAGTTKATAGVLSVRLPAGCGTDCPKLALSLGSTNTLPSSVIRWEGSIEVGHPDLGVQVVHVSHSPGAEGRWVGTMHYFASFPTGGLANLRVPGSSDIQANAVNNGLIRRWGAFRNGAIRFDEMRAVLDATSSGSWKWPSVVAACGSTSGSCLPACYLYDDGRTVNPPPRSYVTNQCDAPIPIGDTTYPIALDLRNAPGSTPEEFKMSARVDSGVALHYAGYPEIALGFRGVPTDPRNCRSNGNCIAPIVSLSSAITIGGRMRPIPGAAPRCPSPYALAATPWLVPGFDASTVVNPIDHRTYVEECRDTRMPYAGDAMLDANLTGSNPVPDGRALRRELRLLDGAMVDQENLVVLFEEHFASSLDPNPAGNAGFSTYGYMLLQKSQELPDPTPPPAVVHDAQDPVSTSLPTLGPVCDPGLLDRTFGVGVRPTPKVVGTTMITGVVPNAAPVVYAASQVHYLCVDTGRFNGGPGDLGGAYDIDLACPEESNVRFFAFPNDPDDATRARMLATDPCQQNGSCGRVLEQWLGSSSVIEADPVFTCAIVPPSTTPPIFCSADRTNLRAGKIFYKRSSSVVGLPRPPLESLIQDAFRYKTRFQSAGGRTLGFAPTLCQDGGQSTPYCYDAEAIQEIEDRLDCLMASYIAGGGVSNPDPAFASFRRVLSSSMSQYPSTSWSTLAQTDGFEKLQAELLIMLGDEAYTEALSSRFDLAATNGATFLGSSFEVNGVDLSGLAGFEMHSLYKAVQYYDLASDRFFRVTAPLIYDALRRDDVSQNDTPAVIRQGVVTLYLERLIGGSTKKARAWSEIARRYQGFHRPDLARRVLDRAYASTYLESVILSQVMLQIADRLQGAARPQVVATLEEAQRRYGLALADMRDVRTSISDDVNAFGFGPDEIPFPSMDDSDTRFGNVFEAALALARQRADTARRFEEDALSSGRAFDTDAASFQSELIRIGLTYEQRLNELCGSFQGSDGRIHPAIVKYASLSTATSMHGDPCGTVGNGAIHEAIGELVLSADDQRLHRTELTNLLAQIDAEKTRVNDRCGLVDEIADFQFAMGSQSMTLNQLARAAQVAVGGLDRATSVLLGASGIGVDNAGGAGFVAAAAGTAAEATLLDAEAAAAQAAAAAIDLSTARWVTRQQCTELLIESNYTTSNLVRSLAELQVRALRTTHEFALAQSRIQRLRLEAQRMQEEQRRAEQLVIDVEAARNDPNIRIYQNAAVLNADRSFQRALEYAYRATLMFEYYSSQSYGKKDALFLVRMVSRDFYNIDNYLDELEDEYEAFRGQYRTRASRVRRISLRDEVLNVPLRDRTGDLSSARRAAAFREALTSSRLLDRDGRLTIPFRTYREQLSACTFNHQIGSIETVFFGAPLGDADAEVWIRQDGIGEIRRVTHDVARYRLPDALMVARPYVANDPHYDPSVYRSYEFRERPFVNTSWSLVFDQKNNPDNQDVDLNNVENIVLYVHYSDFTDPSACR